VWNDHEEQLTSDCAGPMTIGKSGITVKLNGKTVSCGGDATKNGIVITNLTNVHVAGGNVTACGLGVYISGGGGHQINGMNVSGKPCTGSARAADRRRRVHRRGLELQLAQFSRPRRERRVGREGER
jgi:hypothetical protein